jgi:hypothetical protein
MLKFRTTTFVLLSAWGVIVGSETAHGAVTFSGNGIGENSQAVSASVQFSVSGNTLTVILANTSVNPTQSNGSVITGVVFDIEPDLAGSLAFSPANNPSLTAGSNIYVDHSGNGNSQVVRIDNAAPLGGSYTSSLTDVSLGDFGVATTGGNGIFAAGPITLGNGGPDYGLVAPGTFPAGVDGQTFLVGNSGPNNLPFVQNSVTFVFTFTGTLTESQIVGANFLVGTAGDYFPGFPPPTQTGVPEPASFVAWGIGSLAILGMARLRSRRRNAP